MKVEKVVKSKRILKSLRMLPGSAATIGQLAQLYESTEGRVIDAMIETYGPALLRDAKGKK